MKSIILLSLFLSLFFESKDNNQSKSNCVDFKTGKFELTNTESNKKYIIERYSKFQIEEAYDLKSGERIGKAKIFIIKWNNECEYNLMIDTSKSDYDETDLYINSKGGLNCQIQKNEKNCATVITSLEDVNVKAKICKIK